MLKTIDASELILNKDGSIYHLNLLPEQIANTIITVGDPDRVGMVSKYFDRVEHRVQKREFVTHTGYIGDFRLSVVSTGIGTDNIDIVINELDALVNIDFDSRMPKEKHQPLQLIRIGTSGSMQTKIPVDSYLISTYGIGLEGLLGYYKREITTDEHELESELQIHLANQNIQLPVQLNAASIDPDLYQKFNAKGWQEGLTLTATGFYAPQNRNLRAKAAFPQLFEVLEQFTYKDFSITNLEMETAGIYGLAKLLGHQAISLSAILANRRLGTFSKQPKALVQELILQVLETLT